MLGDSRCSHPWKVDILNGSADADYNNQLDWSLSPSLPFLIPFLSHAQHPSSFVPYRLHLSHGGLYIWGIRAYSSAIDVQETKRVLVSTICSLSTGTVGPPIETWAPPTRCQEWIGRQWIIWFEDLVPQMIGIGEWRRPKEFPKGALKMVSSGTLSSLLINNSTHTLCSSSGWPQLPGPTHHYHHSLLPPPLSATKLSWCRSSWFQQNQETVSWIPSSSLPERTQCRQGNGSYHCSTRGDCSTYWNRCLIDAG